MVASVCLVLATVSLLLPLKPSLLLLLELLELLQSPSRFLFYAGFLLSLQSGIATFSPPFVSTPGSLFGVREGER